MSQVSCLNRCGIADPPPDGHQSLLVRHTETEATLRVSKLESALALAGTVLENEKQKGGRLKAEDPMFLVSVQEVLNAGASNLKTPTTVLAASKWHLRASTPSKLYDGASTHAFPVHAMAAQDLGWRMCDDGGGGSAGEGQAGERGGVQGHHHCCLRRWL
eukprot:3358898-Rhodomonas_salina.1